jgi:hypothetical protein
MPTWAHLTSILCSTILFSSPPFPKFRQWGRSNQCTILACLELSQRIYPNKKINDEQKEKHLKEMYWTVYVYVYNRVSVSHMCMYKYVNMHVCVCVCTCV